MRARLEGKLPSRGRWAGCATGAKKLHPSPHLWRGVQATHRTRRIGVAQDVQGSLFMEVTDEIP
jgi:hypothetical protein